MRALDLVEQPVFQTALEGLHNQIESRERIFSRGKISSHTKRKLQIIFILCSIWQVSIYGNRVELVSLIFKHPHFQATYLFTCFLSYLGQLLTPADQIGVHPLMCVICVGRHRCLLHTLVTRKWPNK